MGNLIGRSDRVRQTKVYLELIAIAYIIKRWRAADADTFVGKLDAALSGWRPWQIALASLGVSHFLNNISVLLGLNAPHRSLRSGPELRYSPSFSRVRWFLTAMDAGVLSTARIRWPLLRDTASLLLGLYYLAFSSKGENKVQQFQSQVTPALVKRMWEKGGHPVLRAISSLTTPRIAMPGREVVVPRQDGSLIRCLLFYDGSDEDLARENRLTLNFPGGGFIAMGPEFHTDYLTAIALRTRIPVLTVDYRKALEFPFPAQLLDCFDVYKAVVDSAGTVAGLNTALPAAVAAASPASNSPASTAAANALAAAAADAATSTAAGAADAESAPRPLKLVLFGDSAGGNLATAVVLRAIVLGMPLPCGLHLIYPILEMTSRFWKAQTHVKIEPAATTTPADAAAAAAAGAVPIPAPPQITAVQPRSGAGSPETAANGSSPDPIATLRAPEMTSRAKFSGDAVLPFRYLLVIGQTLFRGGGDPASDMYCSPLLAPDALFAQFPPTSVHVGSVDPLCDDSVGLCERIRRANPAIPVKLDVIPGVSHAYMNVTALLPEGQRALDRTIGWIFEFHALARDKQGILPSYALKQHQQQQQQQQRHQQQLHQQQLLQQQGGAATVALASAPLLQTAQQAGEHARAAAAAAANAAAQAAAMGALTLKNGQALSMWPTLAPLLPQGQQQQPVDSSSVDATLANTVAAVAAETAAGTEATEATEDPAPAAAADSAVGAAPAPVAAKAPAVEDRSPAML